MKISIKNGILTLLAATALFVVALFASAPVFRSAAADEAKITAQIITADTFDADYLSVYGVPTSIMTYEANGGEQSGNPIANAFDGNWNSGWVSGKDNVQGHINAVTVNFQKAVTINRILYCASNNREGYGYPVTLKIYAADGGEPTLYGECKSTPSSKRTMFTLKDSVTVTQLVFEFAQVYTAHKWVATAQEIQFLQPENEAIASVLDLFSDYTQHTVRDEYNSEAMISALRARVKGAVSYENALKPLLDRAEACLNGYIVKDVHREFQTNPSARNPINQYGDMASYARNELLLNSIGTNRQVIGIGGVTGEDITVYVDAQPGDPLPSIVFTQIYGAWNSWSQTKALKIGKNVFKFPNFKAGGSYTVPVNAGGPIHVVNPYTPEQQSSDVKLYFEGGYVYPVFHDGDDETTFKLILDDYYTRLKDPDNNTIVIDAFEAVSDSIILSCTASRAYAGYIGSGWSPQLNIDRWNLYVRKLLSFGGVDCVEGGEYFTERNKHITINYRAVQPYAGMYAFAAGEHIGIPDAGTHVAMILKGTPGWAFAHEFGHTVDLRGRIWGEVTNNMWAMYDRMYIEGGFNDRIGLNKMTDALASDFSSRVGSYFPEGNCSIWFAVEAGCPGYWAGSENAYRYELKLHPEDAELISLLGNTERMIYYGSLGAKDDLRPHFDRWGFYMNGDKVYNADNRWSISKQTETLDALIEKAKSEKRILGNGKKYWYVDETQCKTIKAHGETLEGWASCYSESDTVAVRDILRSSDSYTLILPAPKNKDAHLGYEVQSKIDGEWKVVGFTKTSAFTDTYNYDGATPVYRVFAYDRALNCTGAASEVVADAEAQTGVCKIGDTTYDSLKEAVAAAKAGDTILLIKDCKEGNIAVDKNLTIVPEAAEGTVTVAKNASGHLFNVTKGTLVLGGAGKAKLVVSGNSFSQNGSIIYLGNAAVQLINAVLKDGNNTGTGGAVYVNYGGRLSMNDVIIEDNVAENGGGLYLNGSATIAMKNVEIRNNVAYNRGGGLYEREYQGGSSFNNNNKNDGSRTSKIKITGNSATYGGAIYTENVVDLFNAEISGNSATYGGGFYVDIDNTSRYVGLSNCSIVDNTAEVGSAFYMNRGKTILNDGRYNGNLYKVIGKNPAAVFNLNMVFPDLADAEFELSAIAENGTVLVDGITGNLNVTAEQVKALNIKNAEGTLNGTSVIAVKKLVRITVNYGDRQFAFDRPMGNFALPECVPEFDEKKYLSEWIIDGKEYATGDVISLKNDITVQATVLDYCKITVDYGTSVETKYFKAGDVYYMPMNAPDGKAIFGYSCSDGNYYVYADGAKITGDMRFLAETKKLVKVTLISGDKRTENDYEYNRSVFLGTPQSEDGKIFKYWLIDGDRYAGDSSLKVTRDITATAVFSDVCQITLSVNGEESVLEYELDSVLRLELPQAAEGKKFTHWLIAGVQYFAGADYTVVGDVTVEAVFEDVAEGGENKVAVTLEVLKNGNNASTKKELNAGEQFTLEEPEVDEGKVFLYWTINGVKYNAGAQIVVTENITAVAEIVNADALENTKLTFVIENIVLDGDKEESISRYSRTFTVGETVELTAPTQVPTGYTFEYYVVNGERKAIGDSVSISLGTKISAVYSANKSDGKKKSPGNGVAVAVGVSVGAVVLAAGAAVAIMFALKKGKSKKKK